MSMVVLAIVILRLLLLVAFAAVVAGALMPWSKSGAFTNNGVDGDRLLTLVLAVAGIGVTLLGRRPRAVLITVAVAGVCLLTALIDLAHLARTIGPEVGQGLYLTIAGAAAASVLSALQAFAVRRRQPTPAAVDAAEAALSSSESLG
jgi:hypothetical protein